jgi:hypothetical protein
VLEPDVVEAVESVRSRSPNLGASDWVFVVLGAGAAMGPLQTVKHNLILFEFDSIQF